MNSTCHNNAPPESDEENRNSMMTSAGSKSVHTFGGNNAKNLSDDDEDCVNFLMTLKHRTSPKLVHDLELMKRSARGNPGLLCRERQVDDNSSDEMDGESTSWSRCDDSRDDTRSRLCIAPPQKQRRLTSKSKLKSIPKNSAFIPLGHPDDSFWLSDVQCYVRTFCAEVFSATDVDVSPSLKKKAIKKAKPKQQRGGRRPRVTLGRVGIRCVFCKSFPSSKRASQSVSYPSLISGIYSAVVMMQCRHFPLCQMIPQEVKTKIAELKLHQNRRSSGSDGNGNNLGRQQYWVASARKLGLVDTPEGIRFDSHKQESQTNTNTAPVYNDIIVSDIENVLSNSNTKPIVSPDVSEAQSNQSSSIYPPPFFDSVKHHLGDSTLLDQSDMILVPDFLYLALSQMKPCFVTEVDRVGCYKSRTLGFPGMCCRHCHGQPGFGKYFPATLRSLAQTTTSQTIIKHVGTKCRKCPKELKDAIAKLQANSIVNGGNYGRGGNPKENVGKPRYGSRKVFFQRLWGRLHGLHVPGIPDSAVLLESEEEGEEDCHERDDGELSALSEDESLGTESSEKIQGFHQETRKTNDDFNNSDSESDDCDDHDTEDRYCTRPLRSTTRKRKKTAFFS